MARTGSLAALGVVGLVPCAGARRGPPGRLLAYLSPCSGCAHMSVSDWVCVCATAWAAHAFAPPRLAAAGAPQQAWAASPAQDRPRYAKAALQRVGRPRWGGRGPANAASAPRVGPLWTTRTRAGVGVSAERGGGNLRRAEQWRNRGNKDWEAQRQERNTPAPVFALQRLLRVLAAAFLATWAYAFLSLWLPLAGSALAAAAGVVATGPWAMAVASAGGVSSLAGQAGATLSAVSAAIETSVPALGVVAPVLAAPLGLALLAGGVVRQLLVSPALFVWSSLVLAAQLAKAMCVAAGGVAAAGLGEAVRGVSVLLTSEAVGAVMLRRDVLFYLGMLLFLRTMASSLNLHQVLLNTAISTHTHTHSHTLSLSDITYLFLYMYCIYCFIWLNASVDHGFVARPPPGAAVCVCCYIYSCGCDD